MKTIQLSRGLSAIVDDEDYIKLNKFKWYASTGRYVYAKRNIKLSNGRKTTVYMHRIIMCVSDRQYDVDHANHNTLDNRRKNIRVATRTQNQANKKAESNLLPKGVCIYYGKFRAQIKINKKKTHLGMFKTAQEAANAYDKAAKNHYGEFALTNDKL